MGTTGEGSTPLARAELAIEDLKARENTRILAPTGEMGLGDGWTSIGTVDIGRWSDWSEPQRLAALEDFVPWQGVTDADKRAILEREVDFARIAPGDQRQILGEVWRENDTPPIARGNEDEALPLDPDDRPIRPLTRQLIDCCEMDVWPGHAAITDFGIDSDRHLGALQYAIREGLVTPGELDAAMGSGEKLTEIARRGDNPYRDASFRTAWDEMAIEPEASPEGFDDLAAEIRDDEQAARVRDYGPEDAATYQVRVQQGATHPLADWRPEFDGMMEAVAMPPRLDLPSGYERAVQEAAESIAESVARGGMDKERGGPER